MKHQVHPVYTIRSFIDNHKRLISAPSLSHTHHQRQLPQGRRGESYKHLSRDSDCGLLQEHQYPNDMMSETKRRIAHRSLIPVPCSHSLTRLADANHVQNETKSCPLTVLRSNLSSLERELLITQSALDSNHLRGEAMSDRMDGLEASLSLHNSYTKRLIQEGRSISREIQLHHHGNHRSTGTEIGRVDKNKSSMSYGNGDTEENIRHAATGAHQTIDSLITLISFNLTAFPDNLGDKTPDDIFEQVMELAADSDRHSNLKREVHLLVATAFASNWFTSAQRTQFRKYLLNT